MPCISAGEQAKKRNLLFFHFLRNKMKKKVKQKKPILYRMFLGFCHGRMHLQDEARVAQSNSGWWQVQFLTYVINK